MNIAKHYSAEDPYIGQLGKTKRTKRRAHRRGHGGVSWSSYWATLISATVENAAPTHVVLTFAAANARVTDADFTVDGFTVASGSWTGTVFTLVLSEAVLVFDEDLTITFKSTNTGTVTNNVADDGNTVGWYDYTDASTITMDENNKVSAWNDKSGTHHLVQATAAQQPLLTTFGMTFNDDAMNIACSAFGYAQPEKMYLVVQQVSWTAERIFVNALNHGRGTLYQYGTTPNIMAHSAGTGAAIVQNSNLALGEWGILRVLIHGENSKLQVDETDAVIGNFGSSNMMDGIILGGFPGSNITANVIIKEAIFRNTVDDSTVETAIYNYLKKKVI
jgi:hypothetical protein